MIKQWLGQVRESLDEATVEIGEAQEGLYLLLATRCRPFRNSGDLHWVHLCLSMGDDESEVLNLGLGELALVMTEVEFVLPELFQHQAGHLVMLFHCLCEDQDIV